MVFVPTPIVMGLFSNSPAAHVCGIAINDYGLHMATISCKDRSMSHPVGTGLVSMLDTVGGDQPQGLDETLTALSGPATPLLETDDRGMFGRGVSVKDGYEERLVNLHASIDEDGWDGTTVVSIPPDYSSSAQAILEDTVENAGFDVQQVIPHDVGTSFLAGVNYKLNEGDAVSHPVIVVDLGLWETRVTLAVVHLNEGRVRIRARDRVEAGVITLLNLAAKNALLDYGIPEDAIDPSSLPPLYPLVREAFDPGVDSASGTVELHGERVQMRVGFEHFIEMLADISSVAESFAGEFLYEAEYMPRDVARVIVSGTGIEGLGGNDLTTQVASKFISDDSMATEIGETYPEERVFFGHEFMPHIAACDVARVARERGRDIEVRETLDVEAS
jgi:hypothetical protein